MNFCVDVETLGLESTCVVLSAAIVAFDFDQEFSYQDLKDRSLFVKFDAREQIALKRSIDKSTLEFWKGCPDHVRAMSINKHPSDVSTAVGFEMISKYMDDNGFTKSSLVWQRGTLDSTSLESLAKASGLKPLAHYNNWMDVRTAIRLLKDTCDARAYCKIPHFDPIVVDKHHPVDDICYDVMMLRYGE